MPDSRPLRSGWAIKAQHAGPSRTPYDLGYLDAGLMEPCGCNRWPSLQDAVARRASAVGDSDANGIRAGQRLHQEVVSVGEIEYAKLADGTRLRYLKEGSGPTVLIVLHTVRT